MINNNELLEFQEKNKESIYDAIVMCGYYIKYGIELGDEKLPFNFLDYYSMIYNTELAGLDHHVISDIANSYRFSETISKINKILVNRFVEYANKNFYLGQIVNNPMEILECKYAFEINGVRFEPTYEDVQNIMNVFYFLGIPSYHKLIYLALNRIAKNIPIFPLLVEDNEKKAGK